MYLAVGDISKRELNHTNFSSNRKPKCVHFQSEKKNVEKTVLNISVKKLETTIDAEVNLRKSVLINNTMEELEIKLQRNSRRYKRLQLQDRQCENTYIFGKRLSDDILLLGRDSSKIRNGLTGAFC